MSNISLDAIYDLIGVEDLALGTGTFNRTTSTGGTTEITKINSESLNLYTISTVKQYGAVGDGVTDDAQALQDAFDAGGVVIIPPGEYRSSRGPLVINSDYCKVLCFGTIKLLPGARPWPFDGENQNATSVIHIRDCQGVTWTGGVLDANSIKGCNGMGVGHNMQFSTETGQYCYRVLVNDLIVRNCLHNTDADPGGGTPHDYGIGQGGGKGITLQFGGPQVQVQNCRIHDCTIGVSYEGGSSTYEQEMPDLQVSNLSVKDCMIGLLLRGSYGGPGITNDIGSDQFSSTWTNINLINCGVNYGPLNSIDPLDFGAIVGRRATNIQMYGLRVRNPVQGTANLNHAGGVTVWKGHFRNCYFNGEVDALRVNFLIDGRRDLNGSDPSYGESPSRHNEFHVRLKLRGQGTPGDQMNGFIRSAGSAYEPTYTYYNFSTLVGNGNNDFEGNYGEIPYFYYDASTNLIPQSCQWRVFDRGSGKEAVSGGTVLSGANHKDGLPGGELPVSSMTSYQGLWVQSDESAPWLTLRAADGSTSLGLGFPGTQLAGVAAYVDSNGLRVSNIKPFCLPQMSTTARDAISPVISGQLILNTTTNEINVYANGAWRTWTLT